MIKSRGCYDIHVARSRTTHTIGKASRTKAARPTVLSLKFYHSSVVNTTDGKRTLLATTDTMWESAQKPVLHQYRSDRNYCLFTPIDPSAERDYVPNSTLT